MINLKLVTISSDINVIINILSGTNHVNSMKQGIVLSKMFTEQRKKIKKRLVLLTGNREISFA